MRPRGVLLKEMPGTMAWGHSGKCKSCVQPNGPTDRNKTPKAPAKAPADGTAPKLADGSKDLHLEHTIAGLNSFMADRARRKRIQAAKLNSILDARGNRLPLQAPASGPIRRAA